MERYLGSSCRPLTAHYVHHASTSFQDLLLGEVGDRHARAYLQRRVGADGHGSIVNMPNGTFNSHCKTNT